MCLPVGPGFKAQHQGGCEAQEVEKRETYIIQSNHQKKRNIPLWDGWVMSRERSGFNFPWSSSFISPFSLDSQQGMAQRPVYQK